MGRTACTEPQCLYKGDLYLYLFLHPCSLAKQSVSMTTCQKLDKFYPQVIWRRIQLEKCYVPHIPESNETNSILLRSMIMLDIQWGADKSLARPERNQATATKLGIYSTYSPWSSIHFLPHCSNFCKALKKKNSEGCPSNQVSAAAMTTASDKKMANFQLFLQSKEQVVVQRGQIQTIG